MSLRCVIVDDEYLAIRVIQEYCSRTDSLKVESTFTNPPQALDFLQNNTIDLLFLDIQMPYLNGFELLKKLPSPPMVIFTTARHDYAVQAFELDVLDYLVKPVPYERFEKAVRKAAEYHDYKTSRTQSHKEASCLMVRSDYRIIKIMTEDIFYIEGMSEYVKIFTKEKMHITLAALRDLLDDLPPDQFVRIHKSYIVSVTGIASFNHKEVKMKSNTLLPIGRVYKEQFLKKMEDQ